MEHTPNAHGSGKKDDNEQDRDGVVLVDEELQIILPDARRILVEHFAARAVTDAGGVAHACLSVSGRALA